MIEGLNLEVWGQRARRVKAVRVTSGNRNAILLWLGFTQDEIDNALGGITAELEVGDAIVLTDGGNVEVDDGEGGTRLAPKPGTFTRVAAVAVDYLYRRPGAYDEVYANGELDKHSWYVGLDACNNNDEAIDAHRSAVLAEAAQPTEA